MSVTRRIILLGAAAAAGASATQILRETTPPAGGSFPPVPTNGTTFLNDASQLSPTPIAKHVTLTTVATDEAVALLRSEIGEAKASGRPLIAHAARHSMGAQSLARYGTAITMAQDAVEADSAAGTFRVAGGTRWRDVIARLDTIGFSPAVMQSFNDFGVASTFCVNGHGWPAPFGPAGTTVRSLKMLLASGELVTCSRQENAELFSAAMGGFGLIGIIIELELAMVPNTILEPTFEIVAPADFGQRFVAAARDPAVQMLYGRMDVALDSFLSTCLVVRYRSLEDQSAIPKATDSGTIGRAARDIFRRQVGSNRWKAIRWFLETSVNPLIATGPATRNSLMNEPVAVLDDGDGTRTDILHEYFVDADRFPEFVTACQEVIPSSFQELLNITLRFVDTDRDSVLSYARSPRVAAVLLFSQEKSERAEADMARMTRELIERVLTLGGTYYLPYRPHASLDQFQRAYVRHGEFAALKRRLDPTLVFRHNLWDQYISQS